MCSSCAIPSCLSEVLGLGLAMSGKRCGACVARVTWYVLRSLMHALRLLMYILR